MASSPLCRSLALAVVAAAHPAAAAEGPAAIVVITENVSLPADEIPGALAAAIDAFQGSAALGSDPASASRRLAALGHSALECGSEIRCIARLGTELAVQYVLALGVGKIGASYPVSVTLVDAFRAAAVNKKTVIARGRPQWPELMRELVDAVVPDGFRRPSARIEVQVEPEGAEVTIDGERTGPTPLAFPVPAQPGTHRVRVTKPGYVPYQGSVELEPAGKAVVTVRLEKIPPPPPPEPARPFRTAAYLATGATAIGAGVTVLLGVRMNQAAGTFEAECIAATNDAVACRGGNVKPPPDKVERLQQLREAHLSARNVWLAGLIATIAVGGASGTLFYVDWSRQRASAQVTLVPGGVTVAGEF